MSIIDPSPPQPVDEVPYEDPDQRLGGNDSNTMLEQLHEAAERVGVTKGRTAYEVQQRITLEDDETVAWLSLGDAQASSARDAMRQFSDSPHISPGDVLRAIPVRNVTELTLDIETTTRLRLS